ncbi:MAG TPA: zinc ABC transporter substrate-binding protein [Persephonella sp.]|nr:zinc ABC transporter substrate-binding protein [Persephonella sp.]
MRLLIIFVLTLFSMSFAFAKVKIITTIKPLADIAKEVCNQNCEVNYIIPTNISLHNYEYKYSDLKKIYSADFFVFIGSGEPQIKNIILNIKKENLIPIYEVDGIYLIRKYEFEKHNYNKNKNYHNKDELFHPAIWLDPENAKKIALYIAKKLSEKDKVNKNKYLLNYKSFEEKINNLITYGKNKLSKLKNKDFISYHYLYPYFTNRFSLNYLAVIELGHGKKPTIKHLNYIINLIKIKKIPTIFVSKQFYNERYLRLLKENVSVNIMKLDPFGEGKNYINTIKAIIDKVYKGLNI